MKMNDLIINTVGATTMRSNLSDVLDSVVDEQNIMLIRRRNKTDAALINVELLEDLLATQNKSYVASIQQARKDIESGTVLSLDEAFGEL
jgi:PHD/YefM family antitoxin component YafN of YafNO toxin-antitoxin module